MCIQLLKLFLILHILDTAGQISCKKDLFLKSWLDSIQGENLQILHCNISAFDPGVQPFEVCAPHRDTKIGPKLLQLPVRTKDYLLYVLEIEYLLYVLEITCKNNKI